MVERRRTAMGTGSTSGGAGDFRARATTRLAVGLLLDVAAIGGAGRQLFDGLLVAAVIEANTNPILRDPALHAAYATLDRPPPDEVRRPVSINALATSLKLPFETVRRRVRRLEAEGFCAVTPQGVYVPTAVLEAPPFIAAAKARYARVFQFYADLRAIGAVEPLPYAPPPPDNPRAPVRAVSRVLSDWFSRMVDATRLAAPDPLTGMVLLEIARSSTEGLSAPVAEEALRRGWIPNSERTPVRVAQLSRRVRIPYETTRRHVAWLVEHGLCERAGGGVLVSEAYMQRPALPGLIAETQVNVRRMFRQLAALDGVSASTEAAAS